MSGISGLRKLAVLAAALAVTHQPAEPLAKSGGPFIGPHGGKWADAKHTVAWKENGEEGRLAHNASVLKNAAAKGHIVGDESGHAYAQDSTGRLGAVGVDLDAKRVGYDPGSDGHGYVSRHGRIDSDAATSSVAAKVKGHLTVLHPPPPSDDGPRNARVEAHAAWHESAHAAITAHAKAHHKAPPKIDRASMRKSEEGENARLGSLPLAGTSPLMGDALRYLPLMKAVAPVETMTHFAPEPLVHDVEAARGRQHQLYMPKG